MLAYDEAGYVCVDDYEDWFKTGGVVPKDLVESVCGGSGQGLTVRENRAAFLRWRLVPRALRDVSSVDLGVTLLGARAALPILICPTGTVHKEIHPEAEFPAARAAAQIGAVFVRSEWASTEIEEIVPFGGVRWQQMFMLRDRGAMRELAMQAQDQGYAALCLTVDNPRRARRPFDLRAGRPSDLPSFDPSFGWSDVEWLNQASDLPLVLKGISNEADARCAVETVGVAAVWISNHGGRQLDAGIGTLDALASVADAVAGRIEIYLDGGVRTGGDIAKALALGASAVGIGRPILWGLARGGEAGVSHVLELLRAELEETLALTGQTAARCVDSGALVRAGAF